MTDDELDVIEAYAAGGWERDPKPMAIARLKLDVEKLTREVRKARTPRVMREAGDLFGDGDEK